MKKNTKSKIATISLSTLLITFIFFGIFLCARDFWKTRTINNFRVNASEFKSSKKIKLSKDEITLILLAFTIEFGDGLKEVQKTGKGETQEELLAKIVKFQMQMKRDLSSLLKISQHSLGEEDSATIEIKRLLNHLDQILQKQEQNGY